MPPREIKEHIIPLLQPPLNRLFVPRPQPDFLPSVDRVLDGFKGPRITEPVSYYIHALESSREEELALEETASLKEQQNKSESISEGQIEENQYDPKNNPLATSDPYKTLFVGRLPYTITERLLKREFERFGSIVSVKLVAERGEGKKSRGYGFIEFEREKDMKVAYVEADGLKMEGRRIVVDVERGRTVAGWKPRRLGGGLGRTRAGGKDQAQRYSGRDPKANEFLEKFMGHESSRKRAVSRSRSRSRDRSHHTSRRGGDRYEGSRK